MAFESAVCVWAVWQVRPVKSPGLAIAVGEIHPAPRSPTIRAAGGARSLIEHGPLRTDSAGRRVWRDEHEVELTRSEFTLLHKLLNARGGILNIERLKESLYGLGTQVGSNAINVHIYHLRRKLGCGLIRTVRGLGYRLGDPGALDNGGQV